MQPSTVKSTEGLSTLVRDLQKQVKSMREAVKAPSNTQDRAAIYRNAHLLDLDCDGLELLQPLPVEIIETNTEVVVTITELGVAGMGETELESWASLKTQVVTLWDELGRMPDEQLGKVPRRWKRILNRYVKADSVSSVEGLGVGRL